ILAHRADETDALFWERLDQALHPAAVADRHARSVDAGRQRRFRDDAPLPDRGDKIVPAHDAVPVADEIGEKVENLGLDDDQLGATAKLTPIAVDRIILE